jgi:H+/Cl- antiporter ClcA
LAATFNTPWAARTFVLEEIIGDPNSRYLGGVLLASALGALVGMSAGLGAAVGAPVTGIPIVFEMKQEFSRVPASRGQQGVRP